MNSILQDRFECFICGTAEGLESHHIFFGNPNRKHSEEDGLKVWLCHTHHRGNVSVHFNRTMDLKLKRFAQQKYEETHTREEFMERYGRNWL